jgi:lipoprotein-releasing system permease protein
LNFLFAWRYFKSKKTTNVINIIAWISVTAITVGTAALIIVLSVFNGFEDLVKSLYSDFYTDMKVSANLGKSIFADSNQLHQIKSLTGIEQISLVAEEKALLANGDNQTIVFIKGVDENYTSTNKILAHIIRGKFELGNINHPELVVGAGIENAAGIDVERTLAAVNIFLPDKKSNNIAALNNLNAYSITPSGTFLVQQDFDNKYVFTNIAFVKFLLGYEHNQYSAIEIKLKAKSDIVEIKKAIQSVLKNNIKIETRYEQNKSLYTVMTVEKWIIYGILSLILVVAAFNTIGALTMLVLEKQKDIAVLKSMGASNARIQSIFLSEGLLLSGVGAIAGIILALFICWIQIQFHIIKLSGGSFIIDYYPVQLVFADFVLVVLTVFLIAIIASWIPAKKASEQLFSLKS